MLDPQPTEQGQGLNPCPHGEQSGSLPLSHDGNSKSQFFFICPFPASDVLPDDIPGLRPCAVVLHHCSLQPHGVHRGPPVPLALAVIALNRADLSSAEDPPRRDTRRLITVGSRRSKTDSALVQGFGSFRVLGCGDEGLWQSSVSMSAITPQQQCLPQLWLWSEVRLNLETPGDSAAAGKRLK